MASGAASTEEHEIEIKFSASSLAVAQKCDARLKAEYGFRAREAPGSAALLGTLIHKVIELLVTRAIIERAVPFTDRKILREILVTEAAKLGAEDLIGDAWEILISWQGDESRMAQLINSEIVSMEDMDTVRIKTKYGPQSLIYAIDRLERTKEGKYRIVDLKTTKYPLGPDEIGDSMQAKVYPVVVAMKYPDADEIEFQMDYLRYVPVSVTFTKEKIRRFYREISALIERILEADGTRETINDQCRFCLRALKCETLGRFKQAGASVGIDEEDLAIAAYESSAIAAGWKTRGKYAIEELEKILRASDMDSMIIGDYEVSHRARRERTVNKDAIWRLVPHLKAELGELSPIAALDAAIRRTTDPATKHMLGMLASYKTTMRTQVKKLT